MCDADVCARAGWDLLAFAEACLAGGARLLQLRAKHASGGSLYEVTRQVVERATAAGALVIVNDRADVAWAAGASGVHVGQDDLSAAAIRSVAHERFLIGLSTHTPAQLSAALAAPADYVAIGPVWSTGTKETGYEPLGLDPVRTAAARTRARRMPLVAIGGITLERAPAAIEAGADSVAIISDLLSTGDPQARVREYAARGIL